LRDVRDRARAARTRPQGPSTKLRVQARASHTSDRLIARARCAACARTRRYDPLLRGPLSLFVRANARIRHDSIAIGHQQRPSRPSSCARARVATYGIRRVARPRGTRATHSQLHLCPLCAPAPRRSLLHDARAASARPAGLDWTHLVIARLVLRVVDDLGFDDLGGDLELGLC